MRRYALGRICPGCYILVRPRSRTNDEILIVGGRLELWFIIGGLCRFRHINLWLFSRRWLRVSLVQLGSRALGELFGCTRVLLERKILGSQLTSALLTAMWLLLHWELLALRGSRLPLLSHFWFVAVHPSALFLGLEGH
jgi:hypothetical protein